MALFSCCPFSSDVIAFRAAITSGGFLAELLALAADSLDGVSIKVLVAELIQQFLSLREDATLHLRCASNVCIACGTHNGAADKVVFACSSCTERNEKNEFIAPSHRFSLSFCFGLHSPPEIRTLLLWVFCVLCLFGVFCCLGPWSGAWLVSPWYPYLIQSR